MPTFTQPQPLKASLKIAIFGPAGSGKTFTSLLIAEGLARHSGKRVAFADTEQGTAFYSQPVPQRTCHPEAFDFDVLHSRSISEVLAAMRSLDCGHHGVLVIDSISHLWDSCKNAFTGKLTRNGSIPLPAWSSIKKPYRDLMHRLLSLPIHVIICGRQGMEYGEDDATGELRNLGYRMRAEGETAYEPDLLLRLEQRRTRRSPIAVPLAHVEKDRTGVLAGQILEWPTFANVASPLLGLLGPTQIAAPTEEEVAAQDADAIAREAVDRASRSAALAADFIAHVASATSAAALNRLSQNLTPSIKAQIIPADLDRMRRAFKAGLARCPTNGVPCTTNDPPPGG